ncbi:MAG: nucleotidyltransferase domain-containing protein [Deltaproteobacteria bacterium]|nr:nucleotidyltransferase domain-containing protein [Deltaproteobacteria bacterium]
MIDKGVIYEAAKQLAEKFHPEKIILFGSQARGTAYDRSDVDLLIITAIKGSRRRMMVEMDRAIQGVDAAFDIVILTADEFEEERRIPGTIGRYVSQEGKTLYERL